MVWIVVILLIALSSGFPQVVRKYIFWRDQAECQYCSRTWEKGYMLDCHHIKPLSHGGGHEAENGELVCRLCHIDRHKELFEEAKSRGNVKQMNANAQAIRLLRKIIKQKGIMRYGHDKRKAK